MRWSARLAVFTALALPAQALAQSGHVDGTVVNGETGQPIPNATVAVVGWNAGALTDAQGRFNLRSLPAGTQRLRVTAVGFSEASATVDVRSTLTSTVRISLDARPFELGGIEVTVLRPTLRRPDGLDRADVRQANPVDAGEVLRQLPGVDAVRRGPLGLDPVVRGLREDQIGSYVDGVRMFPAGPARMDSPLSHLDPGSVSSLEVVKGPYALTWGGGNLSAIRVQTEELPAWGADGYQASASTGYDENLNAAEGFGSVRARKGRFSVSGQGAYREGQDYRDGAGNSVEADFRSWEGRGKLGIDLSRTTQMVFTGGYQEQTGLDYPGRLLNADFFETLNLGWEVKHRPTEGPVHDFHLQLFYTEIDHRMDNLGKPTAERNPDRMPSFPLDISLDADIMTFGGRIATIMDLGWNWELEIGGDTYFTDRNAVREVFNADTDGTTPMFRDQVWPDAELANGGAFARLGADHGRTNWSFTVRGDFIKAQADSLSDFFAENVNSPSEISEVTASAAATIGVAVNTNWSVALGLGSVTRPADVLERYSDRFVATRAQMSAEFMGNPSLETERNNQIDLSVEGRYSRWSASVSGFARRVQNYITLELDEDLTPRLPLSPTTVFRYVNGEAEFWGLEAAASYEVTPEVSARLEGSYLWGQETTLDEPVLGITPLNTRATVRYENPVYRFYVEGTANAFAEQDRVAATRGEDPTEGYVTGDVRLGYNLAPGLNLRGGVLNVLDKFYVNHLNARNPFSGERVAEAGRVFFVDLSYTIQR